MNKILFFLSFIPLFSFSQISLNLPFSKTFDFLRTESDFYGLYLEDFWILSYDDKAKMGYLDIEKELRAYFEIDKGTTLYFNYHLIGDLNGDDVNDFVILTQESRFLFSISDGTFFDFPIETLEEGVNSIFFFKIEEGCLLAQVAEMYSHDTDDFRINLFQRKFTLQDLAKYY